MHWFRSYWVNPENGFVESGTGNSGNEKDVTVVQLMRQLEENAFCIGATGFFMIDYAFTAQVSQKTRHSEVWNF